MDVGSPASASRSGNPHPLTHAEGRFLIDVIIENLPTYLDGFRTTLLLLLVSGVSALVLGTVVAAMRISPIAALSRVAAVYTEVVRCTPLTLVLFFFAIVTPILGSTVPFIILAMMGLTIYTSPFIAESLRSGINGVPIGQAEAARSLGMGFGQSVTLIVLPQAFRMVIPPLVNTFVALTKNTSVAGGFFVVELFNAGKGLVNANGNAAVAVLLAVATFYLVITIPLSVVAGQLEKKWVISR